jgi:AcrR family transcriptional regulator
LLIFFKGEVNIMTSSTKNRILDAANKVIEKKGLNCFTLDEVAKEADISKGGLLHHYPSKDKLIKGLIENYIDLLQSRISEREKILSEASPCNWLLSFIYEQFNQCKLDTNTMYGLLAAAASNHDLLNPVLEKRKERFDKINECKDPIMALVISFACDGIAFSNLLGLEVLPEDAKAKLMDRLITLSKECY